MGERCEKVVPQHGSILDRACGKSAVDGVYCKQHRPNAAKLALTERRRKSAIHEAERRVIEAAKEWANGTGPAGTGLRLDNAVRALQEAERA